MHRGASLQSGFCNTLSTASVLTIQPGFAAGLQKQWAVCQKFDTPPMNSAYRRNIGTLAHNFLLSVDNVDAGRQLVEVVCTGVVKHLDSLQVVDSTQTGFAACVNRIYERG